MPNLNKVFMMGHLTRDVQKSFLPSQMAVADFGIATSHKWKGTDGQQKEDTCFIDCQIFGKRADVLEKYFKKGDAIFLEGRLKFDQWEKDGQKRSKHRLIVENFEFVGGKKTDNTKPDTQDAPPANDDDCPF